MRTQLNDGSRFDYIYTILYNYCISEYLILPHISSEYTYIIISMSIVISMCVYLYIYIYIHRHTQYFGPAAVVLPVQNKASTYVT